LLPIWDEIALFYFELLLWFRNSCVLPSDFFWRAAPFSRPSSFFIVVSVSQSCKNELRWINSFSCRFRPDLLFYSQLFGRRASRKCVTGSMLRCLVHYGFRRPFFAFFPSRVVLVLKNPTWRLRVPEHYVWTCVLSIHLVIFLPYLFYLCAHFSVFFHRYLPHIFSTLFFPVSNLLFSAPPYVYVFSFSSSEFVCPPICLLSLIFIFVLLSFCIST